MKRIRFVFICLAVMFLFASCTSIRTGHVGMYPMRYIPVESVAELQSAGFEIIGTVSGTGNVSETDVNDGDTMKYGSLEFLDGDRMYYGVDVRDMSDPYYVALSNAIADMTEVAREVGAAFVTFPNYTIEVIDGRVIARISAIAVKVIEPSYSAAEPFRAEITLNNVAN